MNTERKSRAAVAQPVQILAAPEAMLNIETVKLVTGLSRATIYRRMADPEDDFPRPVRISKNTVRWPAGVISAWLRKMAEPAPA